MTRKRIIESKYLTFIPLFIFSFLIIFSISCIAHLFELPTVDKITATYRALFFRSSI
ncbi:hypothetical protein [Virgibacillus sp. MG-45]|uniref:hypothetical protein n=1 Tax=Virgibacillus sp. MG-45 TaxID=3102791 RepID=UPI003FCC3BA6